MTQPARIASLATAVPTQGKPLNVAVIPATPFVISGIARAADGSMTIGFQTESGKNYRIQYSEDCYRWNDCPEIIPGNGAKVDWIDRGPPSTETPPASATRRFYRVLRLNP